MISIIIIYLIKQQYNELFYYDKNINLNDLFSMNTLINKSNYCVKLY